MAEGDLCAACKTEPLAGPVNPQELFPAAPDDTTTIAPTPYELRPRFTGRQTELHQLLETFRAAHLRRELGFAVVVGEPGMGKTRLVREAMRGFRSEAPNARLHIGEADARGVAFAAFARLLAKRFAIGASDSADEQRGKIVAAVNGLLPAVQATEVAHLVAHLMRVPFADSPVVEPLVESPHQLEARMFMAVRRFLIADARQGPLVLCIENLELCAAETINLLHYLVAGLSGAPVAIVGTARSVLFDRHPSFGDSDIPLTCIDLGPLAADEAEAMLRELCRPLVTVPPALVGHARALRGSPRAVLELIRLLLESEVIVRAGADQWAVDEDRLAQTRIPHDHRGLLAERLVVMAPAEREALDMAATVGETFWLDAVVALVRVGDLEPDRPDGPTLDQIAANSDRTRVAVVQTLAKLVEREWIVACPESSIPGEREYRFAYPPLWHAAYNAVSGPDRRRYHQLVAQWLELRPEGRGGLAQEDIGHHIERAGDARGAAARYRRAADEARANFFNSRAIRLYGRALACLGDADLAARIHLWHDMGSVCELTGDFDSALSAFERMLRLAWVVASRTKAAVALNKIGRVWRRKGDLKLALDYLQRGQKLFEQTGDQRGIAGSLDDIGSVLFLLGRFDEAHEQVARGLAARGRSGDHRSIARSLSTLGNIQRKRGHFAEARQCHSEALQLLRSVGDRAGLAGCLNNLAVLAFELGDWERAHRGWEDVLTEASAIGALPLQALALNNLGELALDQGRHDEARRRLEDALELADNLDDRRLQADVLRNLALLDHVSGGPNAERYAGRALDLARSSGLRDQEGRCLLALGDISAGALFDSEQETIIAGPSPAEAYYRRGIEVLREIGNESELARGLERYGRHKVERGEIGPGRALLHEAGAIFTRLGHHRGTHIDSMLASL
jgi:tetratricopeptide (TPR) repeat protein